MQANLLFILQIYNIDSSSFTHHSDRPPVLIADGMQCATSDNRVKWYSHKIWKGYFASPAGCQTACEGDATMFIFGTNAHGANVCQDVGCPCHCEKETEHVTNSDGSCEMEANDAYMLYRIQGGCSSGVTL